MNMRRVSPISVALLINALLTTPLSASNIVAGKTVTVKPGTGTVEGADLSTITDDAFLVPGTYWQDGTVHWEGESPVLVIELGALYEITSAIVQADDNDQYLLAFAVGVNVDRTWIIPTAPGEGGMQTRTSDMVNPAPIADTLYFKALSGDSYYSVSEIQVEGTLVPEPGALSLFGLAGCALCTRRRHHSL
ncbi:MAG: PEP-CTERM sorting domain-containing protein [Phycisphaeraceae bacterium]|nr:PEP-CTERM sorting domain-containing protein [Phycisphaeraceae bacterium]